MPKKIILLFDLDGVLVKPGGYRAASRDTLLFFLDKMSVTTNLPGEDGLAQFESITITNEWDMVPLALAMVMEALYQNMRFTPQAKTLAESMETIRGSGVKTAEVDYFASINRLQSLLKPHQVPCRAVLAGCEAGEAGGVFRSVPLPVLRELLGHTRDVRRSPTTRIFQQMILGSELFSQTYGLEADLQCKSYLLELDRPLLTEESREFLRLGLQTGRLFCAGLTLRPSLPPGANQNGNAIYSPETELARRFIGLEALPVIGYGEMHLLAERLGVEADSVIKPSPFQALTALAVAVNLNLMAAYAWVERGYREAALEDGGILNSNDEIELRVFEDSVVGILACQRAVAMLSQFVNTRLYAHGIGSHAGKVAALKAVGATIDADINQALQRLA